jgi:hypothetical protein
MCIREVLVNSISQHLAGRPRAVTKSKREEPRAAITGSLTIRGE